MKNSNYHSSYPLSIHVDSSDEDFRSSFPNVSTPSICFIPDYVDSDFSGFYIMYYSHHRGLQINASYSKSLFGPWVKLSSPVLTLEDVACLHKHIASPDVVYISELNYFVMVFHGSSTIPFPGNFDSRQASSFAISYDGIVFNPVDKLIGEPYMRLLPFQSRFYTFSRNSFDTISINEVDITNFDIIQSLDITIFIPNVRHFSIFHANGFFLLFFTRIYGSPEKIFSIPLNYDFQPLYNHGTVYFPPTRKSFCTNKILNISFPGVSPEIFGSRDPFLIFDGHLHHLFYTYCGERFICSSILEDLNSSKFKFSLLSNSLQVVLRFFFIFLRRFYFLFAKFMRL